MKFEARGAVVPRARSRRLYKLPRGLCVLFSRAAAYAASFAKAVSTAAEPAGAGSSPLGFRCGEGNCLGRVARLVLLAAKAALSFRDGFTDNFCRINYFWFLRFRSLDRRKFLAILGAIAGQTFSRSPTAAKPRPDAGFPHPA